ncbi:MAG: H-X9-DG-CTERM domain-containing protein [Verrucomicrobiia bacterium]
MEVLLVIAVLAVFALLIIPANEDRNHRSTRMMCVSNLRQIGVTCNVWADDYGGKFPMQVSMTNNGAMELIAAGNVVACFQVMSNQLPAPKVLLCPADTNHMAATDFAALRNSNISYFVSLDAIDAQPQTLLSGDDNVMVNGKNVQSGILNLHTSDVLAWTKERHQGAGNVLLGDGSVQQATSVDLTSMARLATNRLAIP